MLRDAIKKHDFSEDVEILAKATKIIRNDIFDQDWFKFNGCFPPECQEDSLPTSLKVADTKLMIFMTLASSYTFLAIGICADGVSVCS